jgi:hypothetical protein
MIAGRQYRLFILALHRLAQPPVAQNLMMTPRKRVDALIRSVDEYSRT